LITIIIICIFCILFTAILIWIIQRNKYELKIDSIENEANIKIASLGLRYEDLEKSNELLLQTRDKQIIEFSNTIEKKELELANINEQLITLKSYKSKLETQLDEQKHSLNDKIKLLQNSEEKLKLEFENLANKIFEQNKKQSNDNINLVLKPFKEQLNSFNARVNEIYSEETKQRTSLSNEIKSLKDLNAKISQDAINLTKALKGENKTQGDWGEMILAKILEQTGLKEGREYSVQGSYTDENGKRLRPDVIVHLPEKKDIVIDSKVSLNGYLKYIESENEEDKKQGLNELLKSINTHIKDLSNKSYEEINEVNTLDFVLMFIPIEGAFMLSASANSKLFSQAFSSNIMLVSPSTLFVTLRTIENIWRYEDQNQNAQLISKKAADMYDKFEGFVKDMEDLGKSLKKSNDSYESAFSKLSTGRGNLMRKSEEFISLGVKPKKSLKLKE
jgi:DNA recombination protein RmuC